MSFLRRQAARLLAGERPKVIEGRCVRAFSPMARCARCLSACPVAGISLDHGVHIENCIACGRCVQTCPTGVFQLDEERLLNARQNTLVVGCKHDPTAEKCDLRLSCLQQIHPETVARVLEHLDALVLYADQTICDACDAEWMPIGLTEPLKRLGFPSSERLTVVRDRSFWQTSDISRRRLLRLGIGEAAHLIQASIDDYHGETIAPLLGEEARVPMPRRAIAPLYRRYAMLEGESPYPALDCERCTFCGACTKLCPTGALALVELDGFEALMIEPNRCVACDLCIDVCRLRGLRWQGRYGNDVFANDRRLLLSHAKERQCAHCGRSFWRAEAREEALCEVCLATKKDPNA